MEHLLAFVVGALVLSIGFGLLIGLLILFVIFSIGISSAILQGINQVR